MDLVDRFQKYLGETLKVEANDRIVLAVSGGRDSMLMAYLFLTSGYSCFLAHCNFTLRGEESEKDEQLVRDFATNYGVPCFVRRFQTQAYAERQKISIQMAARELRYDWFESLREEVGAKWIAVAQHRNDHIETVLLNLTRGTGLQGLQGILPRRGRLIRPLLFLGTTKITHYVQELKIPYRDDQSNFSTKYARNKIRLEIIPKFREIAPEFDEIMEENILRFQRTHNLLQSFIKPITHRLFRTEGESSYIEKHDLLPYIDNLPLLFELFRPYGFSEAILKDLQRNWNDGAGKRFQSPSHELLLDRERLWLYLSTEIQHSDQTVSFMPDLSQVDFDGYHFDIVISNDLRIVKGRERAQLDFDTLHFPLQFRFWKEGDYFFPLGMQGRKKISDYFIQEKVALHEKKRIPILLDGRGNVVWIVNYRLDNRYRISKSTKKVLTLVCK